MIFREVEDRDLIAKARRGDVEAYNLLVSRWERRIFIYLFRLVSNREDAMDLSQDVFLKAYQNLPKLDDRIALFGVAVPYRPQRSVLAVAQAAAGNRNWPASRGRWIRVCGCCPWSFLWRSKAHSARLSDDQREAVLLKVYQGFKFEEMAEMLGCPVSTVKSRLYTALDLLKTTLSPSSFAR